MKEIIEKKRFDDLTKEIFDRLEKLYQDMDTAWDNIASLYGFKCNGCGQRPLP